MKTITNACLRKRIGVYALAAIITCMFAVPGLTHAKTPDVDNTFLLGIDKENLKYGSNAYRFSPVSIAQAGDVYLASDYTFLYLLKDNDIKSLPIIEKNTSGINALLQRIGISPINPAGIFYSDQTGLLYVANYMNANVLIGEITSSGYVVHDTLSHPEMKGPEGVFADENYIFIADYVGSAIFIYTRDKQFVKKMDLPLAHTIVAHGDFIYAGGMGGIPLAKIHRGTGKIEKKAKGLHYVTAMQIVDDKISVLDANTGKLYFYDFDLNLLSTVSYTMGPDIDQVLRPYGFHIDGDSLLLADTFKGRILKFTDGKVTRGWAINEPIAINSGKVHPVEDSSGFIAPLNTEETAVLADFLKIPNLEIDVCWQHLVIKNVKKTLYIPSPSGFAIPLSLIWVKYSPETQRLYFGCPTALYLYYIDLKESKAYFVSLHENMRLFRPETRAELNRMETFLEQFSREETEVLHVE